MIIIFTYDRPKELTQMLDELEGKDEILVVDDGSNYDPSPFMDRCEYIRLVHGGKQGWWGNWGVAFSKCRASGHKRFVFMDDDWMNVQWERIEEAYYYLSIYHERFACNILNVGWEKSWTPVEKQLSQHDGFYQVGWVDHGMITNRATLEALEWKMQRVSNRHFEKNGSSGVGKQLSTRLYRKDIPMFTPFKSMAEDQPCESKMHPIERKINPNKAI